MTTEEYERRIQEATNAAIASQAQNNAAQASAVSSVVGNAAQSQAQQLSGGVGAGPDWESPQEQAQDSAEINQAVGQATAGATALPAEGKEGGEPEKKEEPVAVNQPQPQPESGSTTTQGEPIEVNKPDETKPEATETTPPATTAPAPANSSTPAPAISATDAADIAALHNANEAQYKSFTDFINQRYERMKQDEEEMRRQEKANTWSSMATGATEAVASIANLIAVAHGASNQQYHSYSQDWMRKADADMKENRRRRDSMRDTLDRLKLQQEQMRTAQNIEEMKFRREVERAAREEGWRNKQWEFGQQQWKDKLEQQKKDNEMKEKELKIREDSAKASTAQGWARINETKRQHDAAMRDHGYTPRKDGGWDYDPKKDSRLISRSTTRSGGSGGKGNSSSVGGVSLRLNSYNKDGKNIPAETIVVPDNETLLDTLFLNIDSITDLSESQKGAIQDILDDEKKKASEKAAELKRYIVSSEQLRYLLRESQPEAGDASETTGSSTSSIADELRGELNFNDEPQPIGYWRPPMNR